jgi:hydroxypyruvate reductase
MREDALAIFNAAVSAVQPSCLLPKHIKLKGEKLWLHEQLFSLQEHDRIFVIGAGKASAAMAAETENILGDLIEKGIVVTKYDHGLPLKKIKSIEAGHPLPDKNSLLAGREILDLVTQAGEKDIVIALISGGASSLLADFPPETSLADVQEVFKLLLQSGANIHEMNAVRKHLSLIKGGQLAKAAYPATLVSFILSDVIGDPLDVIASGPTVADPTSFKDAYAVLQKYKLIETLHPSIDAWMQKGLNEEIPDTPKQGSYFFERTFNHLIGTNRIALEAAATKAEEMGFAPYIITDKLSGEADDEAKELIDYILMYRSSKPACILMGGETTVTIKGTGKGGRNQQFALAALEELIKNYTTGVSRVPLILSAGTDGSDGPTEATGAMVDEETVIKTKDSGMDVCSFLNNNDAYNFFSKIGGLVITGPTHTNVMDIVIALVYAAPKII